MANESYLNLQQTRVHVSQQNDNLDYEGDVTMFTEIYHFNYHRDSTILTDKLVMTGTNWINLNETRIQQDKVTLKIHYTTLN